MPLTRLAFAIVAGFAMLTGCLIGGDDADVRWGEMPRQLRRGDADMVVERVESEISENEVLSGIQMLVTREAMCFAWPTLWLDPQEQRSVFTVRYDLMARDWGSEVTDASRRRMGEFVEQGYLSQEAAPGVEGAIRYRLTPLGAERLSGSPYRTQRPQFCAPSERRVVAVTSMQHGQFECGSLRVQFTHIADDWPSWARSEDSRRRVAERWGAPGAPVEGAVTLARQWFRSDLMPDDMQRNGELRSVCLDEQGSITGDDLALGAGAWSD